MRLLELARQRMRVDAAVAVVADPKREPILATVGLSQAEVAQVGRMGVPDYRGARALQVSFNGEAETRPGSAADPLGARRPAPRSPNDPGMLAVLTRAADRRFSEQDITTLEDVVSGTRLALEAALELHEPDPVPELDPLTELYDRRAFHALLDREIARAAGRARAVRAPHARRRPADDDQRAHRPSRRPTSARAHRARCCARSRAARSPCRIGGGRFGVLLPQGDTRDGERALRAPAGRPARAAVPGRRRRHGVRRGRGAPAGRRRRRARSAGRTRRSGSRRSRAATRSSPPRSAAGATSQPPAHARYERAAGDGRGARLVQREERHEARERDDAELGQPVALADEAALGRLLLADRPRARRRRAALARGARARSPGARAPAATAPSAVVSLERADA